MLTKRTFDLIAAAVGLLVLAPLLAAIAILIKLDSRGPVLFRQVRVGLHGSTFRIHKFRTMRHAFDSLGPELTVSEDSRITGAGRLLRRWKLDELPQLIDVVRGDMSLVGPRPEVPRYVACYPANDVAVVLSVRPGITDFASIRYRDESALLSVSSDPNADYIRKILPRKLRYYRFYVRQRSMMLDLRIIAMTLCAIAGWDRTK